MNADKVYVDLITTTECTIGEVWHIAHRIITASQQRYNKLRDLGYETEWVGNNLFALFKYYHCRF